MPGRIRQDRLKTAAAVLKLTAQPRVSGDYPNIISSTVYHSLARRTWARLGRISRPDVIQPNAGGDSALPEQPLMPRKSGRNRPLGARNCRSELAPVIHAPERGRPARWSGIREPAGGGSPVYLIGSGRGMCCRCPAATLPAGRRDQRRAANSCRQPSPPRAPPPACRPAAARRPSRLHPDVGGRQATGWPNRGRCLPSVRVVRSACAGL